ncbi:MAG: hypothetical protein UU95_C0003G0036 [Parcubacteria group bacterium GW2011_GWC2_42_12]|uniref:Uncharacterized protein n=2 Tax=Candidatus Falkowiibacteriota TaxID=1752728 RepID=A0A0G0UW65_9BACT|nr:MAG: hypothetical protein UU43_C0002G0065 [Candidatus Falkowbacteria bacterium GW2011_GWA2_41_14]KKS35263.1 MAG: hypothetical protein UU95_C0003G0036 [Parcubacteria group bacterium GW2011_GWC2_42_12]
MNQNGSPYRINNMLIEPSADLYDRIINRISREQKLMILKRRLILRSAGLLLSSFVFIPLTFKLYADIVQSGLMQFLSLLSTDLNIVMANVGDYTLTLLESAPIVSLPLALSAMLAVIFYIAKLEDAYSDYKKIEI